MSRTSSSWILATAGLMISLGTTGTAHGQANEIDNGAYDLSLLRRAVATGKKTPMQYQGIEVGRQQKGQYQRGDVLLVAPQGVVIAGAEARKYIADGKPLQTITYAGMPCSEYGSVALALQALKATRGHALRTARRSPIFRQALRSVVKKHASLRKPAAALDLNHPGLRKALDAYAAGNKAFKLAYGTLQNEISAPVATVINGFGVPPYTQKPGAINEAGKNNYFIGIRKANRQNKGFKDPVDVQMADLLFARFQKIASDGGLDKMFTPKMSAKQRQGALTKIQSMLASPSFKLVFGGSLTGHCAGAANASNTAQLLAAKIEANKDSFPAGPAFLRAMRVVGYGAVYNVPRQITQRRFFLGDVDQFGALNSLPEAVVRDTCVVAGSHMLNPKNGDTISKRPQLRLRATDEVFAINPYRTLSPKVRKTALQRLGELKLRALRKAKRAHRATREHRGLLGRLERSTERGQRYMQTYRVVSSTIEKQAKVSAAKATRYEALAEALDARRLEKKALAHGNGKEAKKQRQRRSSAMRKIGRAIRDARWAQDGLSSKASWLKMFNTMTSDMASGMEYKYIHEGKGQEQMTRLGKGELAKRGAKGTLGRLSLLSNKLRSNYTTGLVQHRMLNQVLRGSGQMTPTKAQALRLARQPTRAMHLQVTFNLKLAEHRAKMAKMNPAQKKTYLAKLRKDGTIAKLRAHGRRLTLAKTASKYIMGLAALKNMRTVLRANKGEMKPQEYAAGRLAMKQMIGQLKRHRNVLRRKGLLRRPDGARY